MILGKTEKKFVGSNTSAPGSSLRTELAKLFWLACAAELSLALMSHSPMDPSWSTWSSRTDFHNWMGRAGSISSDLLLQTFGLGAFAIAILMAWIGLSRVSATGGRPSWRAFGVTVFLFLLSLSGVLQSVFPARWAPFSLNNPGGVFGRGVRDGFVFLMGKPGAVLGSVVFFVGMVIVLFRWNLVTSTLELVRRALGSAWRKAAAFVPSALQWLKENLRRKPSIAAIEPQVMPSALAPAPVLSESIPIAPQAPAVTAGLAATPISTTPSNDEELFRIVTPKTKPRAVEAAAPKPNRGNRDFELPALGILSGRAESKTKAIDRNWYLEKGNILVQKLKDFGVEGEVVHISPGPVITVYEFKPASGVKIKEISNLSDDLTLALSVLSVRIVAPIPGKPVVGIEIPSPHREMVFFKDLIQETPFYSSDIRIPIVLGRLASGEPVVAGLASMPHLLVAGSTGTGKSVFINTLICSLLYRYTPQQLKLILVDPKMVELSTYEGVPHLLLPVVVDSKKAALALRWTVNEMERRYALMHQASVRHVDAYNEKLEDLRKQDPGGNHEFLPYIVVVIDEYADLMAVVPKDVELSIARLAQKARASGIHLVLATQRPSTDVVTGTIKANFPSRISFRVASSVDSKTILDRTGADRLLGSGDMLFHSAGFTSLKRMQGAFISDGELERVVTFLKAQGEPEYDERILQVDEALDGGEISGLSGDASDEGKLYDAAVRLVADKGEASISLIQRHLKIGYNRAATLMEQMEKEGVVAPASSDSKRRAVLVNS